MPRRKLERQKMLFPIHEPKPRPLPRLNQDQAAALIQKNWRLEDGSPIPSELADRWAGLFLHHLRYEPGPNWMTPKLRSRPDRPTAPRLYGFIGVETDWVRV